MSSKIGGGTWVRDSKVGRFQKNKKIELFRPRVNFGEKQKDYLENFVPEGHPILGILAVLNKGRISQDQIGSRIKHFSGHKYNVY